MTVRFFFYPSDAKKQHSLLVLLFVSVLCKPFKELFLFVCLPERSSLKAGAKV